MFELFIKKYFVFFQLLFAFVGYGYFWVSMNHNSNSLFGILFAIGFGLLLILQCIGLYKTYQFDTSSTGKKRFILTSEGLYFIGVVMLGMSIVLTMLYGFQIGMTRFILNTLWLGGIGCIGISVLLLLISNFINLNYDENINIFFRKLFSQIALLVTPGVVFYLFLGYTFTT